MKSILKCSMIEFELIEEQDEHFPEGFKNEEPDIKVLVEKAVWDEALDVFVENCFKERIY